MARKIASIIYVFLGEERTSWKIPISLYIDLMLCSSSQFHFNSCHIHHISFCLRLFNFMSHNFFLIPYSYWPYCLISSKSTCSFSWHSMTLMSSPLVSASLIWSELQHLTASYSISSNLILSHLLFGTSLCQAVDRVTRVTRVTRTDEKE